MSRYMSIWFRHLLTDWHQLQDVSLKKKKFVLAAPDHGRMVIQAANLPAESSNIHGGMVVADARAIHPSLEVRDAKEGLAAEILHELCQWCIRFTPDVAVDLPDGLLLDISGCAHLWGGEKRYLNDLILKLSAMGYDTKVAIADTIGAAWAVARYGASYPVIEPGQQKRAIAGLPAAALRLDHLITDRLHRLGLYRIGSFIDMPRPALQRRFGQVLLTRMDQALGTAIEHIVPFRPAAPYEERMACLEPVRTAKGIQIAVERVLSGLCQRLHKEQKGLRNAVLTCYRVDNETQQIRIGTSGATRSPEHLFKLFELQIPAIRPKLGIELFVLEATVTEALVATQETLWEVSSADENKVAELLDKIAAKIGGDKIHRYLPAEHYWPERSFHEATCLQEQPATGWQTTRLRPVCLLPVPQKIEVTAPLPDYPPASFRYKGQPHKVARADGPERIEQEWWLEDGLHRDYYTVEDENGGRYWLFRSGHFDHEASEWFLHGFFA